MKKAAPKKKKRGKRDVELDLARQQELFPAFTVERPQRQAEFAFADAARDRPVQQWLFDDFFGRR